MRVMASQLPSRSSRRSRQAALATPLTAAAFDVGTLLLLTCPLLLWVFNAIVAARPEVVQGVLTDLH